MPFSQFIMLLIVFWFSKVASSAPAIPDAGQRSREIKKNALRGSADGSIKKSQSACFVRRSRSL